MFVNKEEWKRCLKRIADLEEKYYQLERAVFIHSIPGGYGTSGNHFIPSYSLHEYRCASIKDLLDLLLSHFGLSYVISKSTKASISLVKEEVSSGKAENC